MDFINVKINGMEYSVPKGSTILEAANYAGITIPTLCYMKEINAIGACRMCLVEVKGARGMAAACVYPATEGMEIFTNTPKVIDSRKKTLQLMLSTHQKNCLSCVRSGNCEFQSLCTEYGIEDEHYYDGENPEVEIDTSARHMIRNNNKCILCRRCVAVCNHNQSVNVIGANDRGFATHIACAFDADLADTSCVSCGQCIVACPTGALSEKDDTDKVIAALNDPTKHVVVQTAPAVRAALGEEFGMEIGTNVEGKMVAALRRLGFDKVFDTNFSADLTIMEEAHEFLDRVQNGGTLPLITSCSPGWIKFCEHKFPEFIPNLSSCKSPQQMFGATIKTYYAKKNNIDPKDIVMVSVMPCTAKKFEAERDDQSAAGNGIPDVDVVITTRELARLIKQAGIQFTKLPDEKADSPLGEYTGAAVIFGVTGGVMEAALRTAVETLTGETLAKLEFEEVRGFEGIKEATYNVNGLDVKVAVVSGLSNTKKLLNAIKNGEKTYHFIEVMACPGGCVNGGGQPIQPQYVKNFEDIRVARAKALYSIDEASVIRKSHENPEIKAVYEEFFGKPGSHLAHEILHTTYVKRDKF